MPATLLGQVGQWAIASDESGMVVHKIDDVSRSEKNYLKDRTGTRVGRADYDESMEIEIEGKVTAATPFSQKISGELTLTNVLGSGHLQSSGTGQTLIDEVSRTRAHEDWRGVSVKAEMLPFFPEAA